MTDIDLSEVVSDSGEETGSSSNSGGNRTEASQVHVQGRYGTTTFTNTDGCCVCRSNADAVLLIGVSDGGDKGMRDGDKLVCDHHESHVREDLEYEQERIQRVDF